MSTSVKTRQDLLSEIAELRARLAEAEQTLEAIRTGQVDSIVVSGPEGEQVYTLKGADYTYRRLIEEMNDGAATLAPDGTILYCNRRLAEMLRTPLEDAIGSHVQRFARPDQAEMLGAFLQQGQQRASRAEFAVEATDGTQVPSDVAVSPLRLEDELILCAVFTDLTQHKRHEETVAAERLARVTLDQQRREKEQVAAELARMRDELVRKTRLATIGQVSASIAHDLRNPLGAARNAIYYLKNYLARDDPKLKEYVGIIDSEIGSADRIIGNMLEMARDRAPARQAVDLSQLVGEALAAVGKAKEIRCRVTLTPDPFLVHADPGQLHQVVANLLTNAAQSMESGGEWSVEATRDQETDTILFRDTGPGIPPEVRESLFEPLVTTRAAGIGLGLTICRQIVERHGGTIDVVDHERGGAVFRVRLPRDRRHEPSD